MRIKYLLLLMSLLNFVSYAAEFPVQKQSQNIEKVLNLVMVFEQGTTRETSVEMEAVYKGGFSAGAITAEFRSAIQEKMPVIVQASLLETIRQAGSESFYDGSPLKKFSDEDIQPSLKRANDLLDLLKSNYDVRINKTGDFVVLIPRDYLARETYESLGFNTNNLKNYWEYPTVTPNAPLDINNFKSLFNPEIKNVRKRIYLTGHGNPGVIAQMNRDQYVAFLNAINKLQTDFLYVNSCYAGGANLSEMHADEMALNREAFSKSALNFLIAIGSTTDAPVWFESTDFKNFFAKLHIYFQNPTSSNLKEALREIYKGRIVSRIGEFGSGVPLVKKPGAKKEFRAMKMDESIVKLTVNALKRYEEQYRGTPLQLEGDKTILLYSGYMATPLVISKTDPHSTTKLVSMISGNAYHILESFTAPNMSFETFKNSLYIKKFKGTKTFYIKRLVCTDGIFENVAIHVSSENPGFIAKIITSKDFPELNGSYVYDYNKISANEAAQRIQKMINNSQPSIEALRQATGGEQTLEMLNNEMAQEISKIRLVPPPPSVRRAEAREIPRPRPAKYLPPARPAAAQEPGHAPESKTVEEALQKVHL